MGPVIIEEPEPSRIYIEQQKNPGIMATIVDIGVVSSIMRKFVCKN